MITNEIMRATPQPLAPITEQDARLIDLFVGLKRSPHTREAYARGCRALIEFIGKPLASITLIDAKAYHDHLCEAYTSRHTIKLYVAIAKSLFAFAVKTNYLPLNPFAAIQPAPPATITHKRILSEEDVLKLIDAPPAPRDKLILRLLYAGGLRVSELCALRWDDLTPAGVLHIRHGKGDKERFITLSPATLAKIEAWGKVAPRTAYIFSRQWHGGNVEPIGRVRVHQIIKTAALKAGINPEVSAHWLRHSHGSHALDRGASIVTVRDTLGHSSVDTTNKYLHGKRGDSSALKLAV